jgi:D-aminopeptidase
MPAVALLHETALDGFFQGAAEATEQAILHALFAATSVAGRDGHVRHAFTELAPDWPALWAAS